MTTKEQERQAIQKIRKIVEGMGENSYLAAAMEGVLEVAEHNIEDDAMYSLKYRAEVAEKEVETLKKKNEEFKKALEEQQQRAKEWKSKCEEAYSELQRYTMPFWMQRELSKIVKTGLERVNSEIREASDGMAAAIGEQGNLAPQAADHAKQYREKRSEQSTLNQVQNFLMRYRDSEESLQNRERKDVTDEWLKNYQENVRAAHDTHGESQS